MSPPSARAIDLLRLQSELSLDERGRIRGCHGVTIASARDGQALWIGADVPDAVARALTEAFDRAAPPTAPSAPPPALDACMSILSGLAADGLVQPRGGPSYVIPPDARFLCDATVLCPGDPDVDRLRGANPDNWEPVEWDELLAGQLGPWAIILDDNRVVSICHTPGPMTARTAECGVWTAPPYRGRGYAAATAAAWIPLVRAPGRTLFYSTDADNRSSQRVAARLQLDEIGWTWRLHRPHARPAPHVHPLSSLAAPA
jgi:RimJ/RimL family protein N-acetyltransferase